MTFDRNLAVPFTVRCNGTWVRYCFRIYRQVLNVSPNSPAKRLRLDRDSLTLPIDFSR